MSTLKKDLHALKQQAVKYFEENNMPHQMEIVLNAMFYDQPQDVYGYLVNYFSKFTKPANINKISAIPVLDSNGLLTIQTDVYCTVNNIQKHISSSIIPRADIRMHIEEQEKAEILIQASIEAAINMINSELSRNFSGVDPSTQEWIDSTILAFIDLHKEKEDALHENIAESPAPIDDKQKKQLSKVRIRKESLLPEKPLETFAVGCEVVAAISQAVCACAAASKNISTFQHVAKLARPKRPSYEFRMPLPMVTIMQSGKLVSGKVTCVKEFMIVPGMKMQVDKSIEHIEQIYRHVSKSLTKKQGPLAKLVNEIGALCPQLDTVSQALDTLLEAINAQNLIPGQDMYLAINCAGYECFDRDKGQYEVLTGTYKNSEDMVNFWTEIIQKYPSIIAIIDPLRAEEIVHWLNLYQKISKKVLVIGDNFLERPGIQRYRDLPLHASGIMMRIERMNTISDIIACVTKYQDLPAEMVISSNHGDTNDTFIVDLAVGLNARFLKIGGPYRGERTSKLNRLVQIFQEIKMNEERVIKKEEGLGFSIQKTTGTLSKASRMERTMSAGVDQSKGKNTPLSNQPGEEEERWHFMPHTSFFSPSKKDESKALDTLNEGVVTTLFIPERP